MAADRRPLAADRRPRRLRLLVLLAAALPGMVPAANALPPPEFEDRLVAAVPLPTALAFTPDGRMLVATQPGRLRVVDDEDGLVAAAALDLSSVICSDSERGLLGVAVDPGFATSRQIYLYYTYKKFGSCPRNSETSPVNRVSRFTLADANVVDPASELVLVDNIPSPNGNHNAGDLGFGKDGHLYVTVGDGGCHYAGDITRCNGENDAARDTHVLVGKVLRITPSGEIPPDNPFQGADSGRCNVDGRTLPGRHCRETFAWGLRNPFRIAFDPNASTNRFFINDVGQSSWEEIDEAAAGADYGWNVREGFCRTGSVVDCGVPPPGMTNPVYAYGREAGCASITGGAFVPNGIWPTSYDGDYLYGDYVCGGIFRLERSGGVYTSSLFASPGSPITLTFGPHGESRALYYATYANGGEVRRIAYTGTVNRVPRASFTASPTSGPAPLTVSFDAAASNDPDVGDTLTYLWDFGDGATAETLNPTIQHTYTQVGTFTATLRVRDGRGATSDPVTQRVDPGNAPPVPTIEVPAANQRFAVGEVVTLRGGAVDPQEGAVPPSRLSWTVVRHHGSDHTHPWLPPTVGNDVVMPQAPAPEDISTTGTSYLEIRLTASDSSGLTATAVREFRPRLVDLTFQTAPAGLRLALAGSEVSAPHVLPAWEAWQLGVAAGRQTDAAGRTWIFDSWSDGGAASHPITVGTGPATLTASFHENRAPSARPATVAAVEDVAKAVTLQATDADGDGLTYSVSRPPANGSAGSPVGSQVVYMPSPHYYGGDSFGFAATDGDATSSEANVAVTVAEVNDAPGATADAARTAEDTSVLVDVLANDSVGPTNESSQALAIDAVDDPLHGTAAVEAGRLRFTPDPHYSGTDTFAYRTCDNGTTAGAADPLCASGTIAVTIDAVNDPPVAGDDSATTAKGTSVLVDVLANDLPGPPDETGQALTVGAISDPANGSAAAEAGKIRYTADAGYSGFDSFSYQTCDNGAPALCSAGTVSVTVTDANHAPTVRPGAQSTPEDAAATLTLNGEDADGGAVTFAIVAVPAHGSLGTIAGSTVAYTPAADYHGPDSFTFKASDGSLESGIASFSITVTPVNDPPLAQVDVATTAEDTSVVIDAVANDSPGPANEADQTVRVTSVGPAGHGTATLLTAGADAGKVRYTPARDYNGPDAFAYAVCDDGTTNGAADPECAGATVAFSFSAFDPPLATAAPAIRGVNRAGGTLRAEAGMWSGGVLDSEYEWLRCTREGAHCARIPGATSSSYVLGIADIRRRLRVRVTARNRFGSSSALSTPTSPIQSPVTFSRIVFDVPGRLEDEWVTLVNVSGTAVQLRGWTIADSDGNAFRFGRLVLPPRRAVMVKTGAGADTATRRFWARRGLVWDDRGDEATLRTPTGVRADSCRYRATPSGSSRC